MAYRQKAQGFVRKCAVSWEHKAEEEKLGICHHCASPRRTPAGEDTAAPEILIKKPSLVKLGSREMQCLGKLGAQLLPPTSHWTKSCFVACMSLEVATVVHLWPNSDQQSSCLLHPCASAFTSSCQRSTHACSWVCSHCISPEGSHATQNRPNQV